MAYPARAQSAFTVGRRECPPAQAAEPYALCVLVPTRNEMESVDQLLRRVTAATAGLPVEVVVVDDSDDETPEVIRSFAARERCEVSLVHRARGQRGNGLGGAVVEGLRTARAPWVCVMDADLQHPPEVIPRLVSRAERRDVDLVVASRYCDGGSVGEFGAVRAVVSRASTLAAKVLFPRRLRGVSDPMSGFFLVRRDAIDSRRLRPMGFKILLELLVRVPNLRVAEIGFVFASRHGGASKSSLREGLRYLTHLRRLRLGGTDE